MVYIKAERETNLRVQSYRQYDKKYPKVLNRFNITGLHGKVFIAYV